MKILFPSLSIGGKQKDGEVSTVSDITVPLVTLLYSNWRNLSFTTQSTVPSTFLFKKKREGHNECLHIIDFTKLFFKSRVPVVTE